MKKIISKVFLLLFAMILSCAICYFIMDFLIKKVETRNKPAIQQTTEQKEA